MANRAGARRIVARRQGFTLVELLVVLVIMALLAGLVPMALWATRAEYALRTSAATVAASLRQARADALARGRAAAFVADLRARDFGILGVPRVHVLPRGIRLALLTVTGARLDATRGLIRFFPDGSSTGGAVRLTQGHQRLDVRVDWFSGRVTIVPVLPAERE